MADVRYVRNIYVNGVKCAVRDEEAQDKIKRLLAMNGDFDDRLIAVERVITANYDGTKFTGTIDWLTNYETKVKNSRIPTMKLQQTNGNMHTLIIDFR